MEPYYEKSYLSKGYGTVYSLSDNYGNVFYIGCTIHGLNKRLSEHIKCAKKDNGLTPLKNKVIKSLDFNIRINEISRHWVTGTGGRDMQKRLSKYELKAIVRLLNSGIMLTNNICKGYFPESQINVNGIKNNW